jgi:hypothetical protein
VRLIGPSRTIIRLLLLLLLLFLLRRLLVDNLVTGRLRLT